MAEPENLETFLRPTAFVDSDHPDVIDFANRVTDGATAPPEQAKRLYYAVRDQIRYNPYGHTLSVEEMRASAVLKKGEHFCVPKATLLAAACRALGIPARMGFADVRNHLTTERLKENMKSDLFVFHGYTEIWLGGTWCKVTPTFNKSLCDRFQIRTLEWNGSGDALFHPFDRAGDRHMEYVHDHGTFADVPLDIMLAAWAREYPHWAVSPKGEDSHQMEDEEPVFD